MGASGSIVATLNAIHNDVAGGLARTPDGYLVDDNYEGVDIVDPVTNSLVLSFQTPQIPALGAAIAVFNDGNIALGNGSSEGSVNSVCLYSPTGAFLNSVNLPNSNGVLACAIASDGTLWVSQYNIGLVHLSENLTVIGTILGSSLVGMAIDPVDGTIWGAERGNNRMNHYNPTGGLIGYFTNPAGVGGSVAFSADGNTIYTHGYGGDSSTICGYSRSGTLLTTFTLPANSGAIVVVPLTTSLLSTRRTDVRR